MMPESRRRRALLALLLLGAASACTDVHAVRIGVISTTEGVAGANFAVSEINTSGGIRGRALVVRVMAEGTSTLARAALSAADSLVQDPTVIGVVGHSNSSASLSGSQIYNARHIVQIAPTSSSPLLSTAGHYTFRLVPSDVHQAQFLAEQLTAEHGKPRTAVVFVNDDYGRALFQEFRRQLVERGVPIVLEMPYTETQPLTDVAAAARAVAKSDAQTLVWLGRTQQLRQLLPALRTLVPHIDILASDGVDNAETERNLDGVLTGIRYACFVDVTSSRPEFAALRDRFRAKTGDSMTAGIALTYDAVMLLATAARTVGPRREAIRKYLASLGRDRPAFAGATGNFAFDEHGDPQPSYCLAEVTPQGTRIVRANTAR